MSESTNTKNKIDSILKGFQKKYGEDVLTTNKENNYNVVSTGSLNLDLATGVGGFPLGKFVEIFAWEGTGKSTIALQLIANAQKKGLKCALIEPECSYDYEYGKNLGVIKEDLIMLHPVVTEDAANIAVDLINSKEIDVVIIDSLSALSTQKELEGEVGDHSMGVKARLVGQLCRKVKGALRSNKVLFVVIGQCREKITMFGDPLTTDYGNAVKFFADIRIKMKKKVNKDNTGNLVVAELIKNKVGKPLIECEFTIEFGKGVNTLLEIFETAKKFEILKKHGTKITYGEDIFELTDKDDLTPYLSFLEDNPELTEELRDKIIEIHKLQNE